MNASLPTLPIATASLDAATPVQGDTLLNQQSAGASTGFGPLLQQAVGALDTFGGVPVVSGEDGAALSRQLQGLPQGGKLLPLLQQVLEAATAEGTEARAVFKGIAAKLKSLTEDTDLDPAQAIATAIQQFVDDNPKLAASLGSQLSGLANKDLLGGVSAQTPAAPAGELPFHPRAGTQLPTIPTVATHTANGSVNPENTPDISQQRPAAGLDSLAAGLLPVTPEQREAVLGEAISLFKRLAAGHSKANSTSEGLSRSDSILTALSSATTPTPATSAGHPASAAATPTLNLNVPFNQAGWDKALGERIQWLVGKGIQNANIRLNPAHLGPMEVRIQIQHDQANVQFTSAHGVVRDALEAALPRLRDMFDSSGVQLVDVDVSGQSFAEQQAAANGQGGGAGEGGRAVGFEPREDAEITLETPVYFSPDSGRLDLFA